MQNQTLQTSPSSYNILPANYRQQLLRLPAKLKFFGLLLLTFVSLTVVNAQVNTYTFSSTTGNVLETGGFTNLLGTNLDDDASGMTNIGFSFTYGGTSYTNFSVSSNGLLAFGISVTTEYDNVISSLTGPYLAPYWDDNYTDADGNVQYKLMGVAGSRKLVVEYNLSSLSDPGTADKHFQIWLFETSNKIMFVYGSGNNLNSGFSIAALKNGTTDFISITSAANTASIVTQNNNNTTWPGAGRAYVINGSGTLPVSLINFSGYRDGGRNQLQWSTASEINNLGFEVQRSTDGINFSAIDFVNSLSTGGISATVLNYNYTDNTVTGSRQYYRLRQVDINNRSKLSGTVRIDGEKIVTLKVEGVFPNPSSTTVNIMINSPEKTRLTLFVSDIAGKKIMQKVINVIAGSNTIPVDISQLSNNIYLLKLITASGNAEAFKIEVIK